MSKHNVKWIRHKFSFFSCCQRSCMLISNALFTDSINKRRIKENHKYTHAHTRTLTHTHSHTHTHTSLSSTFSSKLYQNWLHHRRGTFITAHKTTSAVSILQNVWVLIRLWKQQCQSMHVNMRCSHPRYKKERKKFHLNSNDFDVIRAGISKMGNYESNAWHNFNYLLQYKFIAIWAPTKICQLAYPVLAVVGGMML